MYVRYLEPTAELEEESLSANQLIFDKVEKGVPKTAKMYAVNASTNIIIDPPKPMNTKLASSRGSRTSIDLVEHNTQSHAKSSNGLFPEAIDPSKLGGGSSVKLPMPGDAKNHNWMSGGDGKKKSMDASPFDDDFIFPSSGGGKPDVTANVGSSFPKSQTMNFSMPPLVPMHHGGTHGQNAQALSDSQYR